MAQPIISTQATSAGAGVPLDAAEQERYSRHLIMPQVGLAGQQRLKAARVLLIGAGGLGSPLAMYLAAAGVGTLGIVEFDAVDASNLQRQILHGTADVGRAKLDSAIETVARLNPHVTVVPHRVRLNAANAAGIVGAYDLVADGSDNFSTRYLVNDACVLLNRPLVYGSIFRFDGQASVFHHAGGPCYRCLFPEPPTGDAIPNCAEAGVLGVLPGLIGLIQATEVIKLILGQGESLSGRLLLVDALKMRFREIALRRDPACPVCGDMPSILELKDLDPLCAVQPPMVSASPSGPTTTSHAISTPSPANSGTSAAAQGKPAMPTVSDLTPAQIKAKLDAQDAFVLLDVRENHEREHCRIVGDHRHIPMNTVPERVGELKKDDEIVVYCHHGGRSGRVAAFLVANGFTKVRNMTGGIHQWSLTVDSTVPTY